MSPSPRSADEALREAELCARVILVWHLSTGTTRRPERAYREALVSFAEADLRRATEQAALARAQLSGAFEWAYGEPISPGLWYEFLGEEHGEPPHRLHEVAQRIRELHDSFQLLREHRPQDAYESRPEHRSDENRVIRFSNRDTLVAQARRHYEVFTSEEALGIGGANFLLSCSIERNPPFERAGELVLLPGPETLGLIAASPEPDHFLGRVRAGVLRIERVEGY